MSCRLRLEAERKAFSITALLQGDWLVNVGEKLEAGVMLRECLTSDGTLLVL